VGLVSSIALFKNEHLSVSRLKLYEQCPLAFFHRYVEPGPIEPRGDAASFGTVLHAALELVYAWILETEYEGLFPMEPLVASYRRAWQASDLTNVALYQEGLGLLRVYAASHSPVSHWNILAVEQEFNLEVGGGFAGGYVVNGYIDRVDKLADDWISIIDYKSNRLLFYDDELRSDLQMSVYGLVAREFWPWAKRISFVFHMLRHDVHQGTERSAGEIDDAAGYVVALGRRTEDASQSWAPRLNPNCGYCDSRRRCSAYAAAVEGHHEIARVRDLKDFEEVSAKREQLHVLAKIAYARKAELDDVLRARLAHEGDFECNGYRYRTINSSKLAYPSVEALERVFGTVGVPASEVRSRVVTVDKDAVLALRDEVVRRIERPRVAMLDGALEAVATRTPMAPRIDSHAIKGKSNGAGREARR
jgi:hypothetical protein